MIVRFTQKHLMTVMVSAFTLLFCSMVMAEDAAPAASTGNAKAPAVEAQKPAAPATEGNLTFMDPQQAWHDSEVNSYQEWMKRNPRYSNSMFQSQWDVEHGSSFVDSTPDPNYRGWRYSQPWFNRGAVTNVRGRILWVNDRYPSGKYYSSTKGAGQAAPAQKPAEGSTTLMPKAEEAAPAQAK